MASAQISTLMILLFIYLTIHVFAADDQELPFSHLQAGALICLTPSIPKSMPGTLTEDCYVALQHIPSGRLTFDGGDPPTWSIESPAQRRKFLPAEFKYRTCRIKVRGISFARTSLPRSLGSLARTMYYHVWPAAREGVERLLRNCTGANGRVSGVVFQYITFDGHGPYKLAVHISDLEDRYTPLYHVYDATT
jgi:hypothetical protein